jgi:biofilm PGA synthesis N-glycosyltransferase PgaC
MYDDAHAIVNEARDRLDPQPAPACAAEIALARAGIRPLADAGYDTHRTIDPSERATSNAAFYLGVRTKFALAIVAGAAWFASTVAIAMPWIAALSAYAGVLGAWFVIGAIALLPGFMNAFLIASLLLDRRPPRGKPSRYPPVSILIPACNDQASIADTLRSIANQDYPGRFEVIVIDDGSRDRTAAIVDASDQEWLRLVRLPAPAGKAAALNRGLAGVHHDLVVTLDADSYLYRDALRKLVERYLGDPPNTRAVAGTMLVRNSRRNWVTRAQEWDYFHAIAAVKRVQSLYQGTLVAQRGFSIYERVALEDVGGWRDCVGEDVVLTWAMLRRGWRVGHAEDACCFTRAPETVREFVRQRQRWSCGLLEALRQFPDLLLKPRLSTLFVWWNLLVPWLDLAHTVLFVPGLVLALSGVFWIAGPLTLALLPLALCINYVMFRVGSQMFASNGLRVRRNLSGFLTYAFVYSLILQPACATGYCAQFFGRRGRRSS